MSKIKRNSLLVLILAIFLGVIIINYKQIPGYKWYLIKNSYKVHCENSFKVDQKKYIPCSTFLDCKKEKITKLCLPNGWTMWTRCDYECDIRAFCLDGYCRSNSYKGAMFFW